MVKLVGKNGLTEYLATIRPRRDAPQTRPCDERNFGLTEHLGGTHFAGLSSRLPHLRTPLVKGAKQLRHKDTIAGSRRCFVDSRPSAPKFEEKRLPLGEIQWKE